MSEINLYHGNVYNYTEEMELKICVYLCDSPHKHYICIIPMDEINPNLDYIQIPGMEKVAYPSLYKEIDKNLIASSLYIKGKPARMDYLNYIKTTDYVLKKEIEKLTKKYEDFNHFRKTNSQDEKYILTEDYYKYISWFNKKTIIQHERCFTKNPHIAKRQICRVDFGQNIGSEINKLRPALIYKKMVSDSNPNTSSYLVFPISSKVKRKYKSCFITNVNGKLCTIRINDLKRVSVKRIINPMLDEKEKPVFIEEEIFENFKKQVELYFVKEI